MNVINPEQFSRAVDLPVPVADEPNTAERMAALVRQATESGIKQLNAIERSVIDAREALLRRGELIVRAIGEHEAFVREIEQAAEIVTTPIVSLTHDIVRGVDPIVVKGAVGCLV